MSKPGLRLAAAHELHEQACAVSQRTRTFCCRGTEHLCPLKATPAPNPRGGRNYLVSHEPSAPVLWSSVGQMRARTQTNSSSSRERTLPSEGVRETARRCRIVWIIRCAASAMSSPSLRANLQGMHARMYAFKYATHACCDLHACSPYIHMYVCTHRTHDASTRIRSTRPTRYTKQ